MNTMMNNSVIPVNDRRLFSSRVDGNEYNDE